MVAVISCTGEKLMPTTEYRARKLLSGKRAVIAGYRPFAIMLSGRASGDIQPVEVCMDTGYEHIGVSVKSDKHEYLTLQMDTLADESRRHEARAMYRRLRRQRLRYRKPRFDNRKAQEGHAHAYP